MNIYLKNENEEEFNEILDIALKLFSRRKAKLKNAENELVRLGTKAIMPLIYTIELAIQDHDMSDEDIDEHAERVSEVILKIGKDALPYLEDLVTSGEGNLYVNGLRRRYSGSWALKERRDKRSATTPREYVFPEERERYGSAYHVRPSLKKKINEIEESWKGFGPRACMNCK